MTQADHSLDAAIDGLVGRRPEAFGGLDAGARSRLAEVLADPSGTSWMEPAGLLDSDSCGYPVTGGFYDIKSDLGGTPAAPGVRDMALSRLVQEWADDYVLTGRARLDRPWQGYVAQAD